MLNTVVVIIPCIDDFTAEFNLNGILFSCLEPYLAAGKPEVGELCLPAVNKLLLEDTALVKNAVAHTVVALSCKTVKVAGCKSAEAAVTETCIGLALVKLINADA